MGNWRHDESSRLRRSSPNKLFAFPGAKLEGTIFRHPFIERDSLGILGEHVTLEQGTGAVHTAPGHGAEDFDVATKYGIGQTNEYCGVGEWTRQ